MATATATLIMDGMTPPSTVSRENTPQTPVQREEEARRMMRMQKPELVQRARERGLRHTGTKAELITRLTGVRVDAVTTEIPPFEMPGPDATAEELAAAIQAEAENYRGRLQYARDWAVRQHRYGTGSRSGRPCGGGTDQFMRQFDLPPYHTDYGQVQHNAQVGLDLPADFDPAHYTVPGLRHYLEQRVAAHAAKIEEMRRYGISHRAYFRPEALNEVLAAIGARPYEPEYQIIFGGMPRYLTPRGTIGLTDRDRMRAQAAISEAIDRAVREIAGDDTRIEQGFVPVSVSVREPN